MSIAEARAVRDRDATLWSPRDVLISALRDLDAGVIQPEAIVVAHGRDLANPEAKAGFYVASPSRIITLGLLTHVRGELQTWSPS
jgi:hypothetical protein